MDGEITDPSGNPSEIFDELVVEQESQVVPVFLLALDNERLPSVSISKKPFFGI